MEIRTSKIFSYPENALFQERPSPALQIIEQELAQIISGSDSMIQEMSNYLFQAGGKRIRPLMVLYSGLIFSEATVELVRTAAAVELIHMASLVHDDIIDEANLRRSQPALHKIKGPRQALLCGDYLFTKAFAVLAENDTMSPVLHLMAETIQRMCRGELLQARDQFDCTINVERYFERITQKTASFIQSVCIAGAMIGGADSNQLNLLGNFGLHLGIAFQIKDDIMDFCGDATVMGKPKHEDLRQGNLTLPVILALNHPRSGNWLKEVIMRRDYREPVLKKVEEVLIETGSLDKAYQIAALHVQWAKDNLTGLPESPYIQILEHMGSDILAINYKN